MNFRKVNIFMFRLIFTKSSIQQGISKLTKLDSSPASGITFTECFNRYCSNYAQNAAKNVEEFTDGEFETTSNLYADVDVEAITDNNPEKIAAFNKFLSKVWIEHERGSCLRLPKNVNIRQWRDIVSMSTISQQMKYFKFIGESEAKKAEAKILKFEKRKKYEKILEERKKQPREIFTTSSPPVYCLSRTTLFQRIRDKCIEKFYNYKLLDIQVNGPDIVFDCEYSSFMTRIEINSAAFQVGGAWRMNRSNLKPFNVVYTNLSKGSVLYERIKLLYPLLDEDPGYPFTYTPKSFLDLYPKDKLIYLSPHAVETMETYEPDKVYIIGCMVDLAMPEPLSLAKAEKFGIKAMKFPLNKYLNWKCGGKALNMDHCIKIMLDIKNGLDWQTTLLRHIPSRKLETMQPDKAKESQNYLLDARAIRRLYLKNKVHKLIVDEDPKKKIFVSCK